jgi:beta-xylosidase
MDYYDNLSKNDIDYLSSVAIPKQHIMFQSAKGGELKIDLRLEPNEILFVKIEQEI